MASYTPVPRSMPSSERTATITDVDEGDRIDIRKILHRPAKQMRIIPDNVGDVIQFRLNNLIRYPEGKKDYASDALLEHVEVWSQSDAYPEYSVSGEESYISEEGLQISSIEVTSNDGNAFSIIVW